jgi:2'-5' RNA ligase
MRLFVALDIDLSIRDKIDRFLDGVRGFAPEARWVRPESLHITLKFIGEKSEAEADRIKLALGTIQSGSFETMIRGYGFFPAACAPRVFWIGIEANSGLASLAAAVDQKLAAIDIPKEEHAFNPHLTLARGPGGSGAPRWRKGDGPNRSFQRLQEKLSAVSPPEFGTMTAREFFLYRSQLSPNGSKYTKLAAFPLH